MRRFIKIAGKGKDGARDLSYEEALEAFRMIVSGNASDAQISALLMAIRIKGEAPAEIAALALALSEASLPLEGPACFLDCAGPHDGRKCFAATIPASVVCALAGLPILLHASPSLPPKNGESLEDILFASGYQGGRFEDLGYYSAEIQCPPLGRLRGLREELGLRTVLNTAEKMLHVGKAPWILVGVNHKSALERLAEVPLPEGCETLAIVQGLDGSEDLPLHKVSLALIRQKGQPAKRLEMDAKAWGFSGEPRKDLSAMEQAVLIEAILGGGDSAALRIERELVIYNAAFRLWIFGKASTMNEGIEIATEILRGGKCLARYFSWLNPKPDVAKAA